jgi:hypothetical protein
MNLPGSAQVAVGKRLFQRYPWYRFQPHPDWVAAKGADLAGPQAVGIADGVRIIYSPNPDPVSATHLGSKAAYTANYFDPLTGAQTALGRIVADDAGTWTCPPPPTAKEDWVLILEPAPQ